MAQTHIAFNHQYGEKQKTATSYSSTK